MANRIKGITIEIGGNITPLAKALEGMNKKISSSGAALKDLQKLLKLDPSSTTLLGQKQDYLRQQVDAAREKLQQEKEALAQLQAANTTGEVTEEQRALEREISETEQKLRSAEKALRDFGSVGAQQLQAVGDKVKAVGDKIASAGAALTKTVTAPIVGIFTAGGKAALDYGDAIAKVATIADTSAVPVAEFHDEILQLSNDTGKKATELAEAVYQAISASVSTKDAVEFVATATNLAKAGFLETSGAVDVLTTIINAYGRSAEDAELIADQLVQTQNRGKTTVQELAAAMGTVIPTAAALNIPLDQLNVAYVEMTRQGINTANATTYMNGMFTELADSGSGVAKVLQEKTGKTFGQLMADGRSLGDVLEILNGSVDGNSEAFLNLWGNTRAGRGALSIINAGAADFNRELQDMQQATGNVGAALEALDTPGARARKALNRLTNAGIELGDKIAPAIEKAADFVGQLADKWDQLDPKTKNAIENAALLAAAVGPVLLVGGKIVGGVGMLIGGLGTVAGFVSGTLIPAIAAAVPVIGSVAVAAAPFLIGGAIIAGIVAGVVWVVKHWEEIKEAAGQLKDAVVEKWENLKASTAEKWEGIKQSTSEKWQSVWGTVTEKAEGIRSSVGEKFEALRGSAVEKFEAIRSGIAEKIGAARDFVQGAVAKIKGFFNFSWSLPHIKLPHFSVSGGVPPWGFGGKGSLPSISVSWYAKAMERGMILRNPTIFGAMGGKLLGGGERGAEAVVGVSSLDKMIRRSVQSAQPVRNFYFGDINIYGANKTTEQMAREFQLAVERRLSAFA